MNRAAAGGAPSVLLSGTRRGAAIAATACCLAMLLSLLGGCTQDAGSNAAPAKKKSARVHLVELARAERRALSVSQIHVGSLRARRTVRIHTQEAGRITDLPHFEGDTVAEGAVLLRIDRVLLATELTKADAVRREAQANLARLERLAKSKMVSDDEVLRARTALDVATAEQGLLSTRVGYTEVEAPFDGVVSERLAEPGDIAERFDHVLTVMDPSSLIADLEVSELLMPHIQEGAPVQLQVDALGDKTLQGQVLRIHPGLDPVTRQGRVEVEIRPTPRGARPGQLARVSFALQALERLVVPFVALRRDTGGEYVFRLDAQGKVSKVPVRGGRRLADRVEILEGLAEGDQVVTKGFLGLKPDMAVKPVNVDAS